ncbi:SRPBCC family protein [Desulfohalovibrio reitneri]|uniref:SRPBCC family protein n=1 Tax=Desulfohalovibrio reitneri TaxID=1307759 RepID=UPI0004A6D28D|nr:SRPBCC family protein [Desulfohalovibrio reitneri]
MIRRLDTTQDLGCGLGEAWNFFADPRNLCRITPDWLCFTLLGDPAVMHAGQMIEYRVAPFPGLKLPWLTEITHVAPPRYFVDEQRLGPYRLWHHEHFLEEIPGGVRMRDLVTYALPLPPLGELAAPLVRRQLARIFGHRRETLHDLFGGPHAV